MKGPCEDIRWDQDPPANTRSHVEDKSDEVGDQLTPELQEQPSKGTPDQAAVDKTAQQGQQS